MNTQAENKILVVGSYNVGLACQTERIPVWGETITVDNYAESSGGKGSNQAVAASRLGGNVSFIGCLGNDKFGDKGIKMLAQEKVDIDGIIRSDSHTGVGFILLNSEGENCIMVDAGANHDLRHSDIIETRQFKEANIIVLQLENDIKTVGLIMEHANKQGKTVILNPAPANVNAINLLKYADIINPNETELLTLNQKDSNMKVSLKECENLARNLLNYGPETVIVTRGDQGALIVTKSLTKNVPAKSVKPVDTTGAGDSFTGALSVALSEGQTIEKAVIFANEVASYVVTKHNVIPGLPTLEEIKIFKK